MSLLTHTTPAQKPRNFSLFVIALGVSIALLYFGRLFFITLVFAVTIAFLLDPFVNFVMKLRLPRAVASFLVCVVGLLLLYLVGLAASAQVSVLAEELPTYTTRIRELVDKVTHQLDQTERRVYELLIPSATVAPEPSPPEPEQDEPATRRRRSAELPRNVEPDIPEVRIRQERTPAISYIYDYIQAFYDVLLMASFVPFLVYFMLSWKDHFRRSYLQLFQGQDRHAAGRSWEGIADMARAYVFGNFALGVLLSIVSTIFFFAMNLPYFLLVGPISAFLSLIPYIGLPLSMIPPFFVALGVHDRLGPYIIIGAVVAFFHLLALNLLYPKVVGARVHLNPLVVTVSLMFFGILWGGVGLVLAIPVAAGVKAVCDNVPDLQAYGKLLGD